MALADLHWSDRSTLEMLDPPVERIPQDKGCCCSLHRGRISRPREANAARQRSADPRPIDGARGLVP
jgi:hypothetical protein